MRAVIAFCLGGHYPEARIAVHMTDVACSMLVEKKLQSLSIASSVVIPLLSTMVAAGAVAAGAVAVTPAVAAAAVAVAVAVALVGAVAAAVALGVAVARAVARAVSSTAGRYHQCLDDHMQWRPLPRCHWI